MIEGLTLSQLAEKNALLVTENAALQQKLDAVLAENLALKELQPTLTMLRAAHKELEDYDNINLDDDAVVFLWQAMRGQQKTPATEAILNEVRAEGVDLFISELSELFKTLKTGGKPWQAIKGVAIRGAAFATQLRAGSAEGGV